MNKLKKMLTAGILTISALSMTFVVSPVQAATANGDLVRTNVKSATGGYAVYYIKDGKRYLFPSQKAYTTWYMNSQGKADFSKVKVISESEMYALPFGGNVVYRPGVRLVTFFEAGMYAVEPNGSIRAITNAQAQTLYGANWASVVEDIDPSLRTNYTVGTAMADGKYPVGTVLNPQNTSDLYYYDGTNYRKFANEAALLANGFTTKMVVTTTATVVSGGTAISGAEAGLFNPAQAGAATTVVPGSGSGVTVALAADTPAAQTVIVDDTADNAQAYVPFLKLNFTAANDGDMAVKTIKIKRAGLPSLDTDLSNVQLYDGSTKLADYSSFTTAVITFNKADGLFIVPKGTTKTITVTADIADTAVGSHNIKFSVESASDIVTTTGTVSGSFPLTGNVVTTADIGANLLATGVWATVANGSGLTPGDTNQELWRFKLTGANKKIALKKVKLTMVGTIAAGDLGNLKLMQGGTQLGATASALDADKTITFDMTASPFVIDKTAKEFTLRGDIVGGTAREYKFSIQSQDDTEIWDTENNVRIKPGSADSWTVVQAAAATTIASGSLTVNKTLNTATGDIAADGLDQVISTFDFKAVGEPIKITHIYVEANTDDAAGLDNGKIYVDGAQVGSTTDLTEDTAKDFSLGNALIIPAGTTKKVEIHADVKTTAAASLTPGNTIALYLSSANAGGADGNAAAYTKTISLATANAGAVAGYVRTVRSGALTTAKNPVYGDWSATKPTGVKGATQVLIGSFTATVGSGEDIYIDDVRIKDTDSTWATAVQNLNVTVNGTLIGTTVSAPAAATEYTFSANPRILAAKSSSNVINVYADIKSGATLTSGHVHMTQVSATGVNTSADDKDANSRQGQELYAATNGTLTVSLAGDTPASTQLVMGATTPVAVAKFNFEETSGSEDVVIKTLKVINTTTNDYNLISYSLWDGATQVGSTVNSSVSGVVTFSGLSYTIPKSTLKSLVVKAVANAYGNATAGQSEVVRIASGTTYVTAEGASSGPLTTTVASNLNGNTFKVYRTALSATKGSVAQDGVGTDNSRVRSSSQDVAQIKLVANSAYNAKVRTPLALTTAATNTSASSTIDNAHTTAGQTVDGTASKWVLHGTTEITTAGLGFDTGSTTALKDANANIVYDRVSFWIYSDVDLTGGTEVLNISTSATNTAGANATAVDISNAGTASQWYFIDMALPTPATSDDWVVLTFATAPTALVDGKFIIIDQVKLYNDSINFDISGNLAAAYSTSDALPFYLKDSSGVTKATGYFASTNSAGPTSGTVTMFADSEIAVGSADQTYTLYTNTSTLLLAEAGAADNLGVNLDLGSASTAGDIKWYDGAVAQDGTSNYITWVLGPTTPISFSFVY